MELVFDGSATASAAEPVASDLVADAHDAGYRINAWTVTTPAAATALTNAGIDGLIADTPAVVPDSTGRDT